MKRPVLPVVRGTLDVLILRAISQGSLHGFEISVWLEERTDGQLAVDDSALYQALHRLEARKLIVGEWETSATTGGRVTTGPPQLEASVSH